MLVAIPTAMPPPPLTKRLGKRAGTHERLLVLTVVGLAEVDGVLVDLAEQLHRERRRAAPRCSAAAAGRSLGSGEPKFPCPSING